jgi:hypothetical protein
MASIADQQPAGTALPLNAAKHQGLVMAGGTRRVRQADPTPSSPTPWRVPRGVSHDIFPRIPMGLKTEERPFKRLKT